MHHTAPAIVGRSISWRSVGPLVLRLFVIVAIASSVVWRKALFPAEPTTPGLPAETITSGDIQFAVAVSTLAVMAWLVDRGAAKGKRRRQTQKVEDEISTDTAKVLGTMNSFLEQWARSAKANITLNEQLFYILRCMDNRIRVYLSREDGAYFNVSLIVFHGEQGETLAIKARSSQKRRLVQGREATESAAYYAARAGKVKVIHDFKNNGIFPTKGLSEASAPYRSILLLPLEPAQVGPRGNQVRVCKGVVSIDSERPYEFWGLAETDIEVQMRPFLTVLAMMLTAHQQGVRV